MGPCEPRWSTFDQLETRIVGLGTDVKLTDLKVFKPSTLDPQPVGRHERDAARRRGVPRAELPLEAPRANRPSRGTLFFFLTLKPSGE